MVGSTRWQTILGIVTGLFLGLSSTLGLMNRNSHSAGPAAFWFVELAIAVYLIGFNAYRLVAAASSHRA